MKFIIALILGVAVNTLFINPSASQTTPVKIGEQCPDVALHSIINLKNDKAKISDFNGTPLILDFWATWCAPCISMFPLIDSIQQIFKDDIQILGVTDQPRDEVQRFLDNLKRFKNVSIPTVTNDRVLNEIFAHEEIPHYVWIDSKSNVVAVTGAEEITFNNLQEFIRNGKVPVKVKVDHFKEIDEEHPMFITAFEQIADSGTELQKLTGEKAFYQCVFTGYLEGFGSESRTDSSRITCKNNSIGDLYRIAAGKNKLVNLSVNSTIWATTNPELKKFTDSAALGNSKSRGSMEAWMQDYTYCAEIKFPKEFAGSKFDLMLKELNNFFGVKYGIKGSLTKKNVKCLALIKTLPGKSLHDGDPAMHNTFDQYHLRLKEVTLDHLLNILSINLDRYPPLLNQTNDLTKYSFDMNCNMSDVKSLNIALSSYGLQLIEKMADREMIVISDLTLL